MIFFRDFDVPLWLIFTGNLLMLVTCGFYLWWWGLAFPPGQTNGDPSIVIGIALLAGIAAIACMVLGTISLPSPKTGTRFVIMLVGAVVVYALLQIIEQGIFHRETTSELLIITVWGALLAIVLTALHTNGRVALVPTMAISFLLAIAIGIGLVCYTVFYQLDERGQYLIGFVPIAVDAGFEMVFLMVLALFA